MSVTQGILVGLEYSGIGIGIFLAASVLWMILGGVSDLLERRRKAAKRR